MHTLYLPFSVLPLVRRLSNIFISNFCMIMSQPRWPYFVNPHHSFFSLSIPHRCFRHTYISHPVILHNLNIPLCSLFVGTPCISFSGFECLDPHTLFSYCLSLSWLHHSFLLLSIHLFWCHITPTYHCMSSIVDPLCREELLLALSAGILLQLYKTGSLSAFGNIDVCLWL